MKKRRVLPRFGLAAVLVLAGAVLAGCGGTGPAPTTIVGGIDTGEVLDGLVARTRRALSRIDSIDAAKQVRTELKHINEDYDDLLYQMSRLDGEGRAVLARKAARAMPEMQATVNRIHEMPALDDILGTTLDEMLAKLELVR